MNDATTNTLAAGVQAVPINIVQDLWQAKWFISSNFILVSFVAVIFSLLLPVWYKSSATILPPSAGGGELFLGGAQYVPDSSQVGSAEKVLGVEKADGARSE